MCSTLWLAFVADEFSGFKLIADLVSKDALKLLPAGKLVSYLPVSEEKHITFLVKQI